MSTPSISLRSCDVCVLLSFLLVQTLPDNSFVGLIVINFKKILWDQTDQE